MSLTFYLIMFVICLIISIITTIGYIIGLINRNTNMKCPEVFVLIDRISTRLAVLAAKCVLFVILLIASIFIADAFDKLKNKLFK